MPENKIKIKKVRQIGQKILVKKLTIQLSKKVFFSPKIEIHKRPVLGLLWTKLFYYNKIMK
jgi:hypothetical protein